MTDMQQPGPKGSTLSLIEVLVVPTLKVVDMRGSRVYDPWSGFITKQMQRLTANLAANPSFICLKLNPPDMGVTRPRALTQISQQGSASTKWKFDIVVGAAGQFLFEAMSFRPVAMDATEAFAGDLDLQTAVRMMRVTPRTAKFLEDFNTGDPGCNWESECRSSDGPLVELVDDESAMEIDSYATHEPMMIDTLIPVPGVHTVTSTSTTETTVTATTSGTTTTSTDRVWRFAGADDVGRIKRQLLTQIGWYAGSVGFLAGMLKWSTELVVDALAGAISEAAQQAGHGPLTNTNRTSPEMLQAIQATLRCSRGQASNFSNEFLSPLFAAKARDASSSSV